MSCRVFDMIWEIGERVAVAPHLLVCLDFDGTLTPTVDDPSCAYLSPHMERVLRSLAHRPDVTLAILSGRDRGELQAHVGLPGVIYAGNHGLEISGPGNLFIEPTALAHSAALKELAEHLRRWLRHVRGAYVEDKGLTLSVHFRQAASEDSEEVRHIVHRALSNIDHPFQLTRGDKVYEIRPSVPWNKGIAVSWIKQQLGKPDVLVIYAGVDATDEDVYLAHPDGITITLNDDADSAAHYQLDGPAEVRRFLEWLDGRLRERSMAETALVGET